MKEISIWICLISVFILSNSVFSQIIKINKDTLYFSNEFGADSLYITNTGNSDLIIDSFYTANYYSYSVDIGIKDTSFFYYLFSMKGNKFHLKIQPEDTAMFVFSDVDLCPFCKTNNSKDYFQDKIYINSNSIVNSVYSIYSHGYGHASNVETGSNNIASEINLLNNYPNPFNPTTTIKFTLNKRAMVHVEIFDLLGRGIKSIIHTELAAGEYKYLFDGDNLPGGIYFCSILVGERKQIIKMVLLK